MHQLLKSTIENGASELHITPGTPPLLEIDGELQPMKMPPLLRPEVRSLCHSVLTDQQQRELEETHGFQVFLTVRGLGRFHANLVVEDGHVRGVFRVVPHDSSSK